MGIEGLPRYFDTSRQAWRRAAAKTNTILSHRLCPLVQSACHTLALPPRRGRRLHREVKVVMSDCSSLQFVESPVAKEAWNVSSCSCISKLSVLSLAYRASEPTDCPIAKAA